MFILTLYSANIFCHMSKTDRDHNRLIETTQQIDSSLLSAVIKE